MTMTTYDNRTPNMGVSDIRVWLQKAPNATCLSPPSCNRLPLSPILRHASSTTVVLLGGKFAPIFTLRVSTLTTIYSVTTKSSLSWYALQNRLDTTSTRRVLFNFLSMRITGSRSSLSAMQRHFRRNGLRCSVCCPSHAEVDPCILRSRTQKTTLDLSKQILDNITTTTTPTPTPTMFLSILCQCSV